MEQKTLLMAECQGLNEAELVVKVASEFVVQESEVMNYDFLIAHLDQGNYEGDAYFLIKHRETGELFEVFASHCSCYGFEGQWEPQATSVTYLKSPHFRYRGWEEVTKHLSVLFPD